MSTPLDPPSIRARFPVINDKKTLGKYLAFAVKHELYWHVEKMFRAQNIIDAYGSLRTDATSPFNVFAHYATGLLSNAMVDQSLLGEHAETFMVCHNRPECDLGWDNPAAIGASMAGPDAYGPGHVFITPRVQHFNTCNILMVLLNKDRAFLEALLAAAKTYARNRGWSNPLFYVHCWPHNSVQSFHLHVVNGDTVGPWHAAAAKRNLSLASCLVSL